MFIKEYNIPLVIYVLKEHIGKCQEYIAVDILKKKTKIRYILDGILFQPGKGNEL
jgi:hypothetical protein